jgi:transposase
MRGYQKELKEELVRKMMHPNAQSVAHLSRETGISRPTLYNWRNEYQKRGIAVPADSSNPENWSGANKLAVVIETSGLNAEELSEYCRKKGLYPEQVEAWKERAIAGNESNRPQTTAKKKARIKEKQQLKNLKRELVRKEKALAETAALLVLKKKAREIWGDGEEE